MCEQVATVVKTNQTLKSSEKHESTQDSGSIEGLSPRTSPWKYRAKFYLCAIKNVHNTIKFTNVHTKSNKITFLLLARVITIS